MWIANLKIATSIHGDKYLYDIVEIKMVERGGKSPTTSTNNNILQYYVTVNSNMITNDKDIFSLPFLGIIYEQ